MNADSHVSKASDASSADAPISFEKHYVSKSPSNMLVGWTKSLDLPELEYGKVIKLADVRALNAVHDYAEKVTSDIEQYKTEQEQILQTIVEQTVSKVKLDNERKGLEQIRAFQNHQALYFDAIERHCAAVVKSALSQLVHDLPEDKKLLTAIKHAADELKDETDIKLYLHPESIGIAEHIIAQQHDWVVEEDASLSPEDCRFEVPLGEHCSEFTIRLARLNELMD